MSKLNGVVLIVVGFYSAVLLVVSVGNFFEYLINKVSGGFALFVFVTIFGILFGLAGTSGPKLKSVKR